MDAAGEVGQDRDGRKGDQHGPNHVPGDPSRDHQEQGAGTVHHFLQVEGHAAVEEDNQTEGDLSAVLSDPSKLYSKNLCLCLLALFENVNI